MYFSPSKLKPHVLTLALVFLSTGLFGSTRANETVVWNVPREFDMLSKSNPEGTLSPKTATADAIEAAREFFEDEANTNKRLVLFYPPGRYIFGDDLEGGNAINIKGFRPGNRGRLVIRGANQFDTTFVVNHNQNVTEDINTPAQGGIRVDTSERIIFSHFHLTVAQQTVSQGTVVAIGGHNGTAEWIDMKIDDGYVDPVTLATDQAVNGGRYLRRYDVTTDELRPRVDKSINQVLWTHVVARGNGIYRFFHPRRSNTPAGTPNHGLEVDDKIAVKCKHGRDPYRFTDCDRIRFSSIRMTRKTRGLFLRCPNTYVGDIYGHPEWINGKRSRLASPGGGPQFHARFGGFIYADAEGRSISSGYEGDVPGLFIENCIFVNTGDDCLGLFEQASPIIINCRFFNSFARSIFDYRCTDLLRELNFEFNSEYIRATHRRTR